MPLALALLLLVGLSGGWGCLQCDHSVQEMLRQLRLHLISSSFGREQLRARAQALLLGMEGPFFRDYATNVFVGKIGACQGGKGAQHGGERDSGVRARGWAGGHFGATPPRGREGRSCREMGGVAWLSEGPTGPPPPLSPRDVSPGPCGDLCEEPNKQVKGGFSER